MSFMRFPGINLCDKVPDAKTVRKFKNDLAETEKVTIKAKFLFQSFAYGQDLTDYAQYLYLSEILSVFRGCFM